MSTTHWTLSACLLVCLGLSSVTQADEPQLLPRAGVLVLRNGRVLRGNILREGDRYVVGLSEQDEVAVPIDSVEMQCDSMVDAYQRMRSQLPIHAKATDHLELADWCLRYELIAPAAEQLMAAQRCEPQNPANERFERRLRLAVRRPVAASSKTAVTSPVVSQAELDQLVRSFPAGTIEQFTNTIQPLLINHCGANGCHGPTAHSDFRLVYPNWSRTLPRRFTQRNLHQVSELLDAEQPDRSPLLMMATMAHGGAEAPALTEEDIEQLQHLAKWVYRSLKNTDAPPPALVKEPDALLLQPIDRHTAASTRAAPAPYKSGTSLHPNPLQNLIDPAVKPASHVEALPAKGAAYQGIDPFDPEIFNRRFARHNR